MRPQTESFAAEKVNGILDRCIFQEQALICENVETSYLSKCLMLTISGFRNLYCYTFENTITATPVTLLMVTGGENGWMEFSFCNDLCVIPWSALCLLGPVAIKTQPVVQHIQDIFSKSTYGK